MKKLWTILILCLVCAFCAVGFAACGDDKTEPEPEPAAPTSVAMTKDEFLTELVKRETATFADSNLHYATVDVKLVVSEGDADFDGTYEQTCDITYGTNQHGENHIYTDVKKSSGNNTMYQQQRLFCADYFNSMFGNVPADLLSAFKFEQSGDNLKLLCDTTYRGVTMYMEYEFDANGYLKYRKESQGNASGGESVEFTAKVYNKEKVLTVDAFLNTLRELEHLSYSDVRYASVSGTTVEQVGTNPQTTETRDYTLTYRLDGDDNEVVHTENGLTVLGLSWLMDEYKDAIDNDTNSTCTVKKVGSDYDVTAEFDADNSHLSVHYVFDKDGYVVYIFEQEGDAYMVEFTATAYNKTSGGNETVEYTVTAEQWDKGVTLYWTNVTYEYTAAGYGTQKVELLEDGGLHQYAMDGGWGEVYVIYSNGTWKVYNGDDTDFDSEYNTAEGEYGYIENNYGDDINFMQGIVMSLRGKSDLFTFDTTANQYVAENIGIPMSSQTYPMDVTVTFENQKLVYLHIGSGDNTIFEANFWDYGTTVIEYPDYILNA